MHEHRVPQSLVVREILVVGLVDPVLDVEVDGRLVALEGYQPAISSKLPYPLLYQLVVAILFESLVFPGYAI